LGTLALNKENPQQKFTETLKYMQNTIRPKENDSDCNKLWAYIFELEQELLSLNQFNQDF
jgi:hypothetical protein